jgi:hypothetical protein
MMSRWVRMPRYQIASLNAHGELSWLAVMLLGWVLMSTGVVLGYLYGSAAVWYGDPLAAFGCAVLGLAVVILNWNWRTSL